MEKAVREYDYDPLAVRELLKEVKASSDKMPLVILCDKCNTIIDVYKFY